MDGDVCTADCGREFVCLLVFLIIQRQQDGSALVWRGLEKQFGLWSSVGWLRVVSMAVLHGSCSHRSILDIQKAEGSHCGCWR